MRTPAARPTGGAGATITLAIVHAAVVDVARGLVLRDRTVLVSGDRIVAMDSAGARAVPPDARRLDARGGYLIPGLWDMHVHALWDPAVRDAMLPMFLAYGITGIRDMGGDLGVLAATRAMIARGTLTAPRIVAAGAVIDGPEPVDPAISLAAGTPDEGRRAVDSLARAGADFIKPYTLLPRAAYEAVVDRARSRALAVAGHLPAEVSPLDAARLGQRSIEHLQEEIEPFCATRTACAPLLRAFRAHGVWQTPTLVVLRAKAALLDSAVTHPEGLERMPDPVTTLWEASRQSKLKNPPEYWSGKRARYAVERALVGWMHETGVAILAGSDAGVLYTVPGPSLHDELALLVSAGLSPASALRAATLEPARYLDATDSLGTIAPGRLADLVLLDANPLEDIRATRRIRVVILAGRPLAR